MYELMSIITREKKSVICSAIKYELARIIPNITKQIARIDKIFI
ncbi:hypothetical protein BI049_gp127 [Salmonella phage vB_SnwM_CGG4-1]|uniref:Uncharacterized protein n=1 Tax=Salmonella phage vB_SnwM_CGG4-1 TaxID=1815631 RepID=A0A1B0VVP4_9CAUD|nr:hypothetical protein BI049_gp127 [Salmonella phage vB_SnwM_CGG4-1]ANA49606.1 hypothetical protein CGG41_252 [Salmonella phage vB_SnwM_CGG4-1]